MFRYFGLHYAFGLAEFKMPKQPGYAAVIPNAVRNLGGFLPLVEMTHLTPATAKETKDI